MLELETLIERRVARVGVVGLGYVGLPLAVEFAKAGFGVVGIDVDRSKVERIHTDHSVFRWDSIVTHCRLVLDTRNATHGVPNTAGVVVKL